MPNRLAEAKSPYLRKAAGQPVDWIEWGDEAFEQARKRDCPYSCRSEEYGVTGVTLWPMRASRMRR